MTRPRESRESREPIDGLLSGAFEWLSDGISALPMPPPFVEERRRLRPESKRSPLTRRGLAWLDVVERDELGPLGLSVPLCKREHHREALPLGF